MLCLTLVAWTPAHALAAAADAAPTPPRDHQAHAWRMVTRLRQGPRVACAPPVHHFSPSSDATRPPRSQTAALGPRSRLRPPPSSPFGLDRARDGAASLGWGLSSRRASRMPAPHFGGLRCPPIARPWQAIRCAGGAPLRCQTLPAGSASAAAAPVGPPPPTVKNRAPLRPPTRGPKKVQSAL